ncbi:MAG TPA: replication-relaxation family protein [Patescibacteria group bacterium]
MKLPKITTKQQAILLLLYKYRFLNRIQIQTFLKHKYHKRINDWLRDLYEKDYVGRIYSTNFGENTKPAIYYIGSNGIRFLKTQDDCCTEIIQRLYREKSRQESFISRCILIADICLELEAKTSNILSYDLLTESNLADTESPFHFLTEFDFQLCATKYTGKSKKKIRFLLSVFDTTLPRYRMRNRIKKYFEFYASNEWEDATGEAFPNIYVMCPTKALMIYCKRLTKTLLEEQDAEGLHLYFTYEGLVKKAGVTSEIWESVK